MEKVTIPPGALKRLHELAEQVQAFQKLSGCEEALKSVLQGVMLTLGVSHGNVNLKEGVIEIQDEENQPNKGE